MELWVGNNVMRLFSLLYIAAFHTVQVLYFPCVALVAIYGLFVFFVVDVVVVAVFVVLFCCCF